MRRSLLLVALVIGLAAPTAVAAPLVGGPPVPAPVADGVAGCDPVDPAHCLLPFPNDHFTVEDPTTDTGRRVALSALALPTNVAGKPWDPTEWNRNDGFSPGSPILTRVPGLDLQQTWEIPGDQLTDLSLSLADDAPIQLVDAATGERHPFWSELDTHPDTTDADRLLIVRPARNLLEGHRYRVVLRDLRDGSGAVLAPTGPVASERVLAELGDATGVYRAWDFTVASRRNLTERVLTMRDEAFAALGDRDLADGVVTGRPPAFTVDSAVDGTITGTITVPNYLTHQVEPTLAAPDQVTDESLPVAVPGARLVYGDDGLPEVNPQQPTVDVPFDCHLPATDGPVDGLLYGHGLLGGRGEAGGSSTEDLRRRGFMPCAVDWLGMATGDLANVASMLVDLSQFPSLPDRAQQGFLHFLYLGRAIVHPDGFASHPAFEGRLRTGSLAYDGNSQGGIMGGALTALAPDFTRSTLGVPGMNYSTLLNRSVDWEGAYAEVMYAAYPSKIDQQLAFALLQMVWDRGEANGYAHHMTTDPLPGTPPHQVLLQVAYSDHQVANVAAEVEARTIGARLHWPAFGRDAPHWSVDPRYGMRPLGYDAGDTGQSAIVYWYSANRGLAVPPTGNVPPTAGEDPHGDPRKDNAASDQVAHFLRTGLFIDVCGGPCVTTDATRANS